MYNNKITILSSSENYSKVAFYQLQNNKNFAWSWQRVSSKMESVNMDPNNSIALQYNEKIIIATIVKQAPMKIYFHFYVPGDNEEGYWRSVFSPIPQPQKISSHKTFTCFIQSSVMVLDQIYYAIKYDSKIYIYQADVASPLSKSSIWNDQPQTIIFFLDDATVLKCFLSVLDDDVVLIIIKSVHDNTVVEIKSLKPTSQQLQITRQFISLGYVVTATVVPDTRSIAMVYHDQLSNCCHLKILNID